jgi:hypothetical protein
MKRITTVLAVTAALAAGLAPHANATKPAPKDYQGPACSNIVDGDAGYVSSGPSGSPTFSAYLITEVPSCPSVSYVIYVYSDSTQTAGVPNSIFTDGGTLLYDAQGNVVGEALAGNNTTQLNFTWVYYGPTGSEPKTIYFRAVTIVGGHDSDLAPDSGDTYTITEDGGSPGFGMH